tara:strand:- start:16459 stop:17034 length:576 start_codon:yes stop_codon:yes gene_type:complete
MAGIPNMKNTPDKSVLRLRKKHGRGERPNTTSADGARLVRAQSLRNAIVAGLIGIIVFSLFWMTLTSLLDKVLPWFTVVLGILLGYAIRVAGRGLDWRFPALAAAMTLVGALIGNIVVAASVTADEFGIGTLQVLQSVTSMTWPVFIDERLNIADAFFAVVAAGFAAFYANRRLTRSQYYALRLWGEENDG